MAKTTKNRQLMKCGGKNGRFTTVDLHFLRQSGVKIEYREIYST